MNPKKRVLNSNNVELEIDVTMEWDERGFSVNCEVLKGNDNFGEHLIPSMLIHYVRELCRETGLSFESVLRSSMGLPATPYTNIIEA